jgi:hypothetical protein
MMDFLSKEDLEKLADTTKFISAAIAIVGAAVAWRKERKISANIKKDQFNRNIEKISTEFEFLLKQAIEIWSDSDLTEGKRSVIEVQITSTHKNISLTITEVRKNFSNFMGDTQELIDELNKLNQEITGGDFQTKKFKPNKEKAKLIVSEAHGIRKIIRTKIKT